MRFVFIGGCQRSGTTMLGSILGAHKQIICVPESAFRYDLLALPHVAPEQLASLTIDWRFKLWGVRIDALDRFTSYSELWEHLVTVYARQHGREQVMLCVDHTPANLTHADLILSQHPDASFIHILRDGRAVAASVKKLDWGISQPEHLARFWKERLGAAFCAEALYGPGKVLRVRYEELLDDPQRVIGTVCDFLGISFQNSMLRADGFDLPKFTQCQHKLVGASPDTSRKHSWMHALSPREVELFEYYAGRMLAVLGYGRLYQHPRPPSFWERRRMGVQAFLRRWTDYVRFRRRVARTVR